MLIGYARVSKSDGSQTLDLQQDALIRTGVDPDYIYKDLASGRKDTRPGLDACLKALQPGNTLMVWKLDRLGRDLKHLINLIDDLRKRDVGFKVLTGHGAQIDTTTANGRLVFGIFAALAEFERELIVERTHAGLAAARARGRLGELTTTAMRHISALFHSHQQTAPLANKSIPAILFSELFHLLRVALCKLFRSPRIMT